MEPERIHTQASTPQGDRDRVPVRKRWSAPRVILSEVIAVTDNGSNGGTDHFAASLC